MTDDIFCESSNDILFRKVKIDTFSQSRCVIVPETHNALVVVDGIAHETLPSGRHYIFDRKKSSIVISDKKSPLIEIIYISKTAKLNIYWGTINQWEMRDPVTGTSIKLGASGEFEVQVCNPRKTYLELIGRDETFDIDNLKSRLLGRLLAEVQYSLATTMAEMKLSYDRLGEVLLPMSKAILPAVKEMFEKDYGLTIFSFTISNIIISEDDIKKIAKAKALYAANLMKKEEWENKEKKDDKDFERQMLVKKMEIEDYEKYLETVNKVGWPANKTTKAQDAKECPNCQAQLKGENKFCPVCGYSLEKTKIKCPNCNKLVLKSDTFCKHCGTKL